MKAEDYVRRHYPTAELVERRGTFVGGSVRYEVWVGRKCIGMDYRRRTAWAEAMRWIKKTQT